MTTAMETKTHRELLAMKRKTRKSMSSIWQHAINVGVVSSLRGTKNISSIARH